jgi:hypothetical protein
MSDHPGPGRTKVGQATTGQATTAQGGLGEQATRKLLALMDEFITLVVEENATLARGLPSSLALVAARKGELACEFELWVKAANARAIRLETAPEPVRTQFIERLAVFQTVMEENVARLEAAIEASRRRIDAVMTAIRQEMTDVSPYRANGKTQAVSNRKSTHSGIIV